ncbi:MAG TPA: peptidoglycan-binding protein [Planctomycetota bacterium]|nr:peptidoglycan-binding protein [Planctomycetota bacterium]
MFRALALGAALVLASAPVASAQVQGVDVSEFQGNIDWGAAHAAGIGFAFARVSDGVYHMDPTFQANWNGMRANGVVRGVYQFFRAGQNPVQQADLLVNAVGSFGPGDLPPVADVEVMDGVGAGTLLANLQAWCDEIRARTGLTPIIYTGPGFWNPLGGNFSAETLWVAHWFVSSPQLPNGWGQYAFWQYDDNGSVPGIPATVDQDVWNGSLAALVAYAHGGAPPSGGGSVGDPVLSLGSVGPAVVTLQQLLTAQGFSPGGIDGDFGPHTLAAVRAFQGANGLAVDGVVGPRTWAALRAPTGGGGSSEPTIQEGSTGPAVSLCQQLLTNKGYDPGGIDGDFGPNTRAAVIAFQAANGLATDGVVGPMTWAALQGSGASAPPPSLPPTIRYGDTGLAVAYCQQLLNAKGFDTYGVDGDFGPNTLRAVYAFQASRGLSVDGIVGPMTWTALLH